MTTNALARPALQDRVNPARAERMGQYTFWQIFGLWALAALPMMLLSWVVAPALIPYSPLPPAITYWLLMIAGMGWQGIVSLVIVYRELGTLRWSAIRQRTWLQTPLDPHTGQSNAKLFWWLVPAAIFAAVVGYGLGSYLEAPFAWLFPALKPAVYMEMSPSPGFEGQWWLLGITLVSLVLNYFLGEEFFFRGILLPKMQGVFGRYDWLANSVLFGLYHLHKPWSILSNIVIDLGATWPARRFRSNWMAIVIHGAEGLMVLAIILSVVLGLMPG